MSICLSQTQISLHVALRDELRKEHLATPPKGDLSRDLWSNLLPLTIILALEPENLFLRYLSAEGSDEIRQADWLSCVTLRDQILRYFRSERRAEASPRPSDEELDAEFGADAPIVRQIWSVIRFLDAVDKLSSDPGQVDLDRRKQEYWSEAHVLLVAVRPALLVEDAYYRTVERCIAKEAKTLRTTPKELARRVATELALKPDLVLKYAPSGNQENVWKFLATVARNAARDESFVADDYASDETTEFESPGQFIVTPSRSSIRKSRARAAEQSQTNAPPPIDSYSLGDLVKLTKRAKAVVSEEIREYSTVHNVTIPRDAQTKKFQINKATFDILVKRLRAKRRRNSSFRATLKMLAEASGLSHRALLQALHGAIAVSDEFCRLGDNDSFSSARVTPSEVPCAVVSGIDKVICPLGGACCLIAGRIYRLEVEQAELVLARALKATGFDENEAKNRASQLVKSLDKKNVRLTCL